MATQIRTEADSVLGKMFTNDIGDAEHDFFEVKRD